LRVLLRRAKANNDVAGRVFYPKSSRMLARIVTLTLSLLFLFTLLTVPVVLSGCVSSRDALRLEKMANNPLMKNLQDNDEDLTQIEDGTGAAGEASACPT